MEAVADIESLITKLKSLLPICRVCLDISMDYIEFEASFCVFKGHEITYSEAFHELAPDFKTLPNYKMPTNFCASCAEDLLNAYLFLKRVENANSILNKVKIFAEENTSYVSNEEEQIDVSEAESDSSDKENVKLEIIHQNNGVGVDKDDFKTLSTSYESIKTENFKETESDHEALPVCIYELSMDKHGQQDQPETPSRTQESKDEEEPDYDSILGEKALCFQEHKHKSHANLKKNRHCKKQNAESETHLSWHGHQTLEENEALCQTEEKQHIDSVINVNTFHPENCLVQYELSTETCSEPDDRNLRVSPLENHLETFSVNKEYVCNLCEETFPNEFGLKQHSHFHTQSHHRYACHICGKICSRPFTLRKHVQYMHTSERRKYQCEECGLFFPFPSYLRDHRRKHNKSSRFKCPYCDRTFLRKTQLVIHTRYHFNEFPYKCDSCDKCYVTKSNLTDHIKSKHTKTTYDCDKCNQKFKSQTGLRKHKYSHDGYPYNCPLCNAGATSRSSMKQHMMGVHKDAVSEDEFDAMFPIIVPKTGYRRPKDILILSINECH